MRKSYVEFFFIFSVLLAAIPTLAAEIKIGLPLACTLGTDCFVQNFVDADPGPEGRDYQCQTQTYDGHKGVDFRILDIAAMKRGVSVLAVAPGNVLRVRDGMPDRLSIGAYDASKKNRECGNGVVIDHGQGWTTQYCHLKRNSIRVRSGGLVERGTIIGQVGLSGKTEFPHVHLTVRKNDAVIDPMTSATSLSRCGLNFAPLFEVETAKAIQEQGTSILNAEFSTAPVTMRSIEQGSTNIRSLERNSPVLIFYVRAIWLKSGDRMKIKIVGPSGELLVTHTSKAMERDKAQWMIFAGKKRPVSGWPKEIGRAHV